MANNIDKQINVRMSLELYQGAKELADKSGWTIAAWIRKSMEEKIERDSGSGDLQAEIKKMVRDAIQDELKSQSFAIISSKKEQLQRL